MKENAVKELMSIYAECPSHRTEILEALGEVGGDHAIKEIMDIYKKYPTYSDVVIKALGEAGKNSLK